MENASAEITPLCVLVVQAQLEAVGVERRDGVAIIDPIVVGMQKS